MLVLSRQRDASIMIGEGDDAVEVVIVDVRGDKVRLGITAPREIPVHPSFFLKILSLKI